MADRPIAAPRWWTIPLRAVFLIPLAALAWIGERADDAYWFIEEVVR